MKTNIFKIIFSVILCLSTGQASAQFYVKSSNQQFVEDAVRDAFFVFSHSYQIRDKKGELYGLNSQKDFGVECALGIKVADGVLLTVNAVEPWNYDPKFKKYQDKYTPVTNKTQYTALGDKADYKDFGFNSDSVRPTTSQFVSKVETSVFDRKGLLPDRGIGEKKGWMIWVVADKDMDIAKSAAVDYVIYRYETTADSNDSVKIDKPGGDRTVVGGAYVISDFSEMGTVRFKVCGVVRNIGEQWYLSFPFAADELNAVEAKVAPKAEADLGVDELTPVGDKKKQKRSKHKKGNNE